VKTIPLSQLKVDPVLLEDSEILVSSNWLKQMLKDYQKTINEVQYLYTKVTDLKELADAKAQYICALKQKLVLQEPSFIKLDINA